MFYKQKEKERLKGMENKRLMWVLVITVLVAGSLGYVYYVSIDWFEGGGEEASLEPPPVTGPITGPHNVPTTLGCQYFYLDMECFEGAVQQYTACLYDLPLDVCNEGYWEDTEYCKICILQKV